MVKITTDSTPHIKIDNIRDIEGLRIDTPLFIVRMEDWSCSEGLMCVEIYLKTKSDYYKVLVDSETGKISFSKDID